MGSSPACASIPQGVRACASSPTRSTPSAELAERGLVAVAGEAVCAIALDPVERGSAIDLVALPVAAIEPVRGLAAVEEVRALAPRQRVCTARADQPVGSLHAVEAVVPIATLELVG